MLDSRHGLKLEFKGGTWKVDRGRADAALPARPRQPGLLERQVHVASRFPMTRTRASRSARASEEQVLVVGAHERRRTGPVLVADEALQAAHEHRRLG